MSAERRTSRDDDGVRITQARGRGARLLGIVFLISAVSVIALSAAAVWWLRRDEARVARPADPSAPVAPMLVAQAHPVRAVPRRTEANAEKAAEPAVDRRQPPPQDAPATSGSTRRAAAAPAASAPPSVGGVPPNMDAPPDAAAVRDDREIERVAEDVIAGMRAAGETRGLAAIPPRGTNPVKSGVVVPNDYPLPEGYVRHYQTTDDGRRLEPILMFSPDYEFVDDQGKPIAVPKDGIVPPDMAPAGMPVRVLEIPASERPKASRGGE